jgi:hypothetical protein
MKKIIGIIGVVVIAMTMFFNTNSVNGNTNEGVELASFFKLNTANAECAPRPSCSSVCGYTSIFYCTLTCEDNSYRCDNSFPRNL